MVDRLFERILLTNDDGINSEGLQTLRQAAEHVCDDVWIVAPEHDQSGTSASISLHSPLRLREVSERVFAVVGTPCDSVIMAVRHLLKDRAPDLVMSGINRGINLSDDVLFSGTTNAAVTASFLGTRAIAFSQAHRGPNPVKWQAGDVWVPKILRQLVEAGWANGECFNVNFPDSEPEDILDVEFVRQGRGSVLEVAVESRMDMRQKPYFWFGFTRAAQPAESDTDVAALKRGSISVTPLKLDRTNYEILERFAKV